MLNNADVLSLDPTKFFATFLEETKAMAPEERAAHLERSREIDSTHAQFASVLDSVQKDIVFFVSG